ncbi:TatD DNase family protein [Povalibacter uvarum]|uniref:TatD DNase family protein n=1 Tax=Povalibacter uvarum TaxID=732238 RepID=A0A841HJ07_9GAMM|nr:TatD family hydrolase [Povalibacter uvarum]MBB6092208.1 TatD DNase family protein [Povalibacter uvarum]
MNAASEVASRPPELVDIGLNLAHDSFDADRGAVIENAIAAGVTRMVITGSSLASTHAAIDLVRRYPTHMRGTAGVHPHHATDLTPEQLAQFSTLAAQPEIVAVGECGLDYFRDFSPRDAQRRAFEQQLELATAARKPVFLHERDAHEDFVTILRKFRPRLTGGVAHCFTGTVDQARAYLDLDLYVGITGWICDERRGLHLREVVRHIPANRLLIETDAPYLLPRDLDPKPKSRRNEPVYLPHVLETIARARGESVASLAEATTRNALTLFDWKAETPG